MSLKFENDGSFMAKFLAMKAAQQQKQNEAEAPGQAAAGAAGAGAAETSSTDTTTPTAGQGKSPSGTDPPGIWLSGACFFFVEHLLVWLDSFLFLPV